MKNIRLFTALFILLFAHREVYAETSGSFACLGAVRETLLREGKVKIPDFGRFYLQHRAARSVVTKRTGKRREYPARTVVRFQPSESLKEDANALTAEHRRSP